MGLSRREALKRGVMLIGGALGIGAVGAAVGTGSAAAATLELSGRNWRLNTPRDRLVNWSRGERLAASGDLVDAAGEVVGSFVSSYLATGPYRYSGGDEAASFEVHTFRLSDGSIFGSGTTTYDLDAADEYAVIGGTGKYAGARGTYLARQRPLELGGDGTAHFTVTLLNQGGR